MRGSREHAEQPAEVSRPAAPRGTPAPAVLALQRTAGNAAVSRAIASGLIARETATAGTDPRLTYSQAAKDEGQGLDAKALPYKDPSVPNSGWSSGEILQNLTQIDEDSGTFTDPVRCGANSVLAAVIPRGPGAVADLARKTLDALQKPPPPDSKADPADRSAAASKVAAAAAALGTQAATYGDLSRLAHGMKVAFAQDPKGATTGHEVVAMAGLAGPVNSTAVPVQDPKHVFQLAEPLEVGEAMLLLVDTDVPDPNRRMRRIGDLNHWVTVGKRRATTDAPKSKVYDKPRDWMLWMYDPYPRVGTQLMDETSPGFFLLLSDEKGVPKSVYRMAVVKKPQPDP
jgi:hypothetical protein